MTEIEQIKQLRDRTGAGLMDCKSNHLVERKGYCESR